MFRITWLLSTLLLTPIIAAEPVLLPAKQAYLPTSRPDRIILTWTADPSTSQAVTWRTDTVTTTGLAQLALSENGPNFDALSKDKKSGQVVRTITATTQLLKTDLSEAHYHTAEFLTLIPKTKYVYRVGDGKNWSEWFAFETACSTPEPFGFIYFGDAQNDIKRHWSRIVRGAYSDMPKAKFIIHAGDLINSGNRDEEWGEWHGAAGWINGMVPSFPTPGNHEYSGRSRPISESVAGIAATIAEKKSGTQLTTHWRATFALPTHGPTGLEESAHYMDYQGVRFVSLNSNEKQKEQVEWLDSVLQNNPNRWTVLTFHHPIYSPAKGRDNKTLRELWRPIIDKHGVDLVLTGHDHTYGRSSLMREDNTLTGERLRSERGTVYVVSVSGPKLYPLRDDNNWMKASAKDTQLYQLIRFDGDKLHYQARTAKGEVYDEFELRKQADGRNIMVERETLDGERASTPQPSRQQLLYATAAMAILALGYAAFRMVRNRGTA